MPAPPRTGPLVLLLAAAVAWLGLLWLYAGFTAEDAYIVYRYAENWVGGEGLVFNPGERINALTSPLHAFVCAGLYALTGATEVANKLASALAVALACALVLGARRYPAPLAALFVVLVAFSPFVALWTVGGLETPFLLAWVSLAVVLAERAARSQEGGAQAAFSLALGLAFLTRFDSVLFSLPLFAAVFWETWTRPTRDRPASRALPALLLPGAVPVAAWLGFSRVYFRDLLPTSFYHKTPGSELWLSNLAYSIELALLSGLLALAVFVAWLRRRSGEPSPARDPAAGSVGVGAAVGLVAVGVYGLGAATTHMMFSYRLFVPYLPVAALLLLDRWPLAAERRHLAWIGAALALSLQLALAAWIELGGINPGTEGEYRRVSRRQYEGFLAALVRQSDAIGEHWERVGTGERAPRVYVYAAGIVPYRMRQAHVLDGGLVSYRHAYDGNGLVPPLPTSADYVMTMTPHLGPTRRQLEEAPQRFERVYETRARFDDVEQTFAVWYNPHPTAWRLPPVVDAPADLVRARLPGRDLRGSRLAEADLTGAVLTGADLADADLRRATLARVDLRRANLSGARLAGADLRQADLRGADLSGATGLTQAQLDRACGSPDTTLSEGLTLSPCPRAGPRAQVR